jgi:hypothetical protein
MPNLLAVPFSCHLAIFCDSYACKLLPKEMGDVIRGIYNHFSRNSARKRVFKISRVLSMQLNTPFFLYRPDKMALRKSLH